MTALGIDIDLTVDFLEDHYADHCKCESVHGAPVPPCTTEVTHRFSSCTRTAGINICSGAYDYVVGEIAGTKRCHYCRQPARDCWTVTPA